MDAAMLWSNRRSANELGALPGFSDEFDSIFLSIFASV